MVDNTFEEVKLDLDEECPGVDDRMDADVEDAPARRRRRHRNRRGRGRNKMIAEEFVLT